MLSQLVAGIIITSYKHTKMWGVCVPVPVPVAVHQEYNIQITKTTVTASLTKYNSH